MYRYFMGNWVNAEWNVVGHEADNDRICMFGVLFEWVRETRKAAAVCWSAIWYMVSQQGEE
jgi:hypothetical protein